MPAARAILVIDLAFGDCGKGTIVDFLTRHCDARTGVRFNGGPQAGHNVVTPDGRHHTFSQFGSGTFVPGVRTLLSRFTLVEPYAMLNEAAHLEQLGVADALDRLLIDAACPVITPPHQCANRLREIARGSAAHGTCGVGVGEAAADLIDHPDLMIRAAELPDRAAVRRKLRALCDLKADQLRDTARSLRGYQRAAHEINTISRPTWIDAAADNYAHVAARATIVDGPAVQSIFRGGGTIIFEGAQGVLLDESFGFHPHTTWSTTTFANADTLLNEAGHDGPRTRLGVLRTYFTRHGSGPLVTEDNGLRAALPESHNADAGWQGRFRVGAFDAVAARYALAVAGGVDGLAVTHLDRLPSLPPQVCTAYRTERPPSNPLFIHYGKLLTDIRVPRSADFDHLTQLTHALRHCAPDFTTLDSRFHAPGFLDVLRDELRTPVAITSSGATFRDKRLVEESIPKNF